MAMTSTKRGRMMAGIADQKIEGAWAIALKLHITIVSMLIPPILAWSAWITAEQFHDKSFRESGERFTQKDGRKLEDKIVDELSPKIDIVDKRMQSIERDSTRIFTKLEQIEQAIKNQ